MDIMKTTNINPGIKAEETDPVRLVKVKTIGDASFTQVEQLCKENTYYGWQPAWEEIIEPDTVPLDTVTIFNNVDGRDLHQTTIPIPLDIFPDCESMSLAQIKSYAKAICEREHWPQSIKNWLIVLNNLNMELRD